MKRFLLMTVALLSIVLPSQAMSYEQARQQALFLTDKMAYELNLTEEQYEAAYEVNFDYLLGVNTPDEIYGTYWTRRNLDLSYILLDWQYNAFLTATYFYRPLYWDAGFWHFGIYARYPHRDYFYFGRPVFFDTYRGDHCWHMNGDRSWYHGRDFVSRDNRGRNDREHFQGMRDGYRRGDFGTGQRPIGTQNQNHGGQTINRGAKIDRQEQSFNGRAAGVGAETYKEQSRQGAGSLSGNRTSGSSPSFGSRRSSTRQTVDRNVTKSTPATTTQRSSSSSSATRQTIGGRSISTMKGTSANVNRSQSARTSQQRMSTSPSTMRSSQMSSPSMSTRSVRSSSPSMSSGSTRSSSPSMGSRSVRGSRPAGGASHGGRR